MAPGLSDPPSAGSLLQIAGPAEAMAMLSSEAAKAASDRQEARPIIQDLSAYLDQVWTTHSDFRSKNGVEDQIFTNLRAINNEYEPDKADEIEAAGGADVYMGVTGVKYRAAVAWLTDIFSTQEDRIWTLKPTPIPDLGPEDMLLVQQQAVATIQGLPGNPEYAELSPRALLDKLQDNLRAEINAIAAEKVANMERKITDQFIEGGFYDIFEDFLADLVGSKAGIIKGPVVRMRKRKTWVVDPVLGTSTLQVVNKPILTFDHVSPLDAYPAPFSIDFRDDFIERLRLNKGKLDEMLGQEGYDDAAILAVLGEFDQLAQNAATNATDSTRAELEDRGGTTVDEGFVEGKEFWLAVQGKLLKTFGKLRDKDGGLLHDDRVYDICALKVGGRIIYCDFNREPQGRKPYSKYGWMRVPGSFWYKGVPELMQDLQRLCNAAARSLANNMAIASGPQVVINDINRMTSGEDITTVEPFRVWQFINTQNSQASPLDFKQPDDNSTSLLNVYNNFAKMADDYTGIPAYQYGNEKIAGAGRTSSGLSMLMSNSARGIKKVILGIDRSVIKDLVERVYDWNLEFDPDPSIKGDAEVVASGSIGIMVKEEMAERRMAMLTATNNPTDLRILSYPGRAKLLREALKPLEVDGTDLIPPDDELKLRETKDRMAEQEQRQAEVMAKSQGQMQSEGLRASIDRERMVQEADARSQEIGVKQQEIALKQQQANLDFEIKKIELLLKRAELGVKLSDLETKKGIPNAPTGAVEPGSISEIVPAAAG